jgi:dihydrodipicolinate synthase/N-acetylneuraminate lyase
MVTPSKEGVPLADPRMFEYYANVAEGINIPIVLQDHPASTLVNMSVPLLAKLVRPSRYAPPSGRPCPHQFPCGERCR